MSDSDIIRKILNYSAQCKSSTSEFYETEIIIKGYFVTEESVNKFYNKYLSIYPTKILSYYETKVRSTTNENAVYRYRIYQDHHEIQCKSKLFDEKLKNLWSSIRLSCESTLTDVHKSKFEDLQREPITRISMNIPLEEGSEEYLILELGSNFSEEKAVCWVELEIPNEIIKKYADPRKKILPLVNSSSTFSISFCDKIVNIVKFVIKELQGNSIVVGIDDYKYISNMMNITYGKPVTLNYNNVDQLKYCTHISKKYDGIRTFLIYIENIIYKADTRKKFIVLDVTNKTYDQPTILDCELINENGKDIYYIMDVLINKGQDMRKLITEDRLKLRDEYITKNICIKPFDKLVSMNQIHLLLSHDDQILSDGIIFITKKYNEIYKWKPDNTVDVLIRRSDENQTITAWDCNNNAVNMTVLNVPDDINNIICEFSIKNNTMEFRKVRYDKPQANSLRIIENNTSNLILSEFFLGNGAYFMRKYHNEVKRNVINKIASRYKNIQGKVLIDIGSGQLGDISKWKAFDTIYCIEPNTAAFVEGINRIKESGQFENIRQSIIPIHHKVGEYNSFKHIINKKVCMINMFFCINLFEQEDLEGLKLLLTECSDRKCTLSIMLLMNPVEDDNECFQLQKIDKKKYTITIKNSRIIGLTEYIITRRSIIRFFESVEFILEGNELLNKDKFISSNEAKLSQMYELIIFQKGR
jgi:hypothetical protein